MHQAVDDLPYACVCVFRLYAEPRGGIIVYARYRGRSVNRPVMCSAFAFIMILYFL
jgi:hypothetical protein